MTYVFGGTLNLAQLQLLHLASAARAINLCVPVPPYSLRGLNTALVRGKEY